MNNNIKKLFLLGGDIIVLYFSLYLTLLLRYQSRPSSIIWETHIWPFTLVFVLWVLIFYISNFYSLHFATTNSRFFQRAGRSIAIASLFSIVFFYVTPNLSIAPKRNLFIFIIIFSLLFLAWRQFFNWLLKAYLPKIKVAFVGYNNLVSELIAEFKQKPHLGYEVGYIFDNSGEQIDDHKFLNTQELNNFLNNKKIDILVLSDDPQHSGKLRSILFKCLYQKISYTNLPNFYELVAGKVSLDLLNQMWFLNNLNEGTKTGFDTLKRIYDFLLAFFILVVTFPFWLIIAIIIKLESRGPVFFISSRVGKNDSRFKLYKFRTMREEGNDHAPTIKNDRRITKFGMFLRKTRLDEIPQVINILKGEMSFVGPRPERPELASGLEKEIPFYRERTLVKPGLTGSDQISGEYHSPSREDSLKKLQYDLFYIKNRSIYLDTSIILKTIATVISRQGM